MLFWGGRDRTVGAKQKATISPTQEKSFNPFASPSSSVCDHAQYKQDLEGLDWRFIGQQNMRMAKGGDAEFNLYDGKVRIDGQEFDIPVHAGDGVPEILLGRQWLTNRRLVVDLPSGVLTLGAS